MPADIRAQADINDTGIPEPELNVYAKPVDTMVKPISASGRALGQLAGSLKSLTPDMKALSERFAEKARQGGTVMADQAFEKDGADWDKAVKNGDAPSWLNPYARVAARQQYGVRAGDQMAQDVSANPNYIAAIGKATTPQEVDSALHSARNSWEQDNLGHSSHSDLQFQAHYQQIATAHMQELRAKALDQVEKNFTQMTGVHLQDTLFTHIESGKINAEEDEDQLADELSAMLNGAKAPEKVKRAAINNAIDSFARRHQDISAYDIASKIHFTGDDGKDYSVDNPEFNELAVKGHDEINRSRYQAVRLDNAAQLQKQNKVRNDVVTQMSDAIAANPNKSLDLSQFKKAGETAGLGTNWPQTVDNLYKSLQQPATGDTATFADLSRRIHDGRVKQTDMGFVSTASLTHALSTHSISMDEYRTLQGYLDRRDAKYASRGGRSQADPETVKASFQRGIEEIGKLFSEARLKGLKVVGDPWDLENAAQNEYITAYQQYMQKNREDVDPQDLDNFLRESVQALNSYYFSEGEAAKESMVATPEGVGKTVRLNTAHAKEKKPIIEARDESDYATPAPQTPTPYAPR